MAKRKKAAALVPAGPGEYGGLVTGIADLLAQARRGAARAVNSILTATYWEVGRRIVEFEQGGKARADYGESLLTQLASDLTAQFGRGFSRSNLQQMRLFYQGWDICQTPSGKLEASVICQTLSGKSPAQPNLPTSPAQGVVLQTVSGNPLALSTSCKSPTSSPSPGRTMSA